MRLALRRGTPVAARSRALPVHHPCIALRPLSGVENHRERPGIEECSGQCVPKSSLEAERSAAVLAEPRAEVLITMQWYIEPTRKPCRREPVPGGTTRLTPGMRRAGDLVPRVCAGNRSACVFAVALSGVYRQIAL
jgi:hypothetical protein